MSYLEVLSLLTQVNRKLDFDEATSFTETKTADDTIQPCLQKPEKNQAKCPGFGWDRVNFPLSSCCILDLVEEEC